MPDKKIMSFLEELEGKTPSQKKRDMQAQAWMNVMSGKGTAQDSTIAGIKPKKEGDAPEPLTPSERLKELRARRELEALKRIESGQGTARDSLIAGEKPLPKKEKKDEKKGRKETNTDKLNEYLSLRNKAYSSAHDVIPYMEKETDENMFGKSKETVTPVKMTMPERYKESDLKTARAYQDSIDLTHDAMKMNVHVNQLRQVLDDAHANIQAVKEEAQKTGQRIDMNELKQMIQEEYGIPWEMLAKYNYVR
jgi:outer membrane murein-binding lipoprotein Lpp